MQTQNKGPKSHLLVLYGHASFVCLFNHRYNEFCLYCRLKNERIRIHEQLALTIILVQIFFLVGIDRTENRVCICKAVFLYKQIELQHDTLKL